MQILIPFTAGYRPLATGLGVVALELLVAVAATNRLRSRLRYRIWRRAHYLTLAVWFLATTHGILAGTDRDQTWLLWLYAVTVALVTGAGAVRFGRAPAARRLGLALGVVCGALAAVLGLSALPQASSRSASAPKSVARTAIPQLDGNLSGTIEDEGSGVVYIQGTAAAGAAFRIDLLTAGDARGADRALQLRFAGGATCEGTLTSLDETGFSGTCNLPNGSTQTVQSTWTVSNGTVAGRISTAGNASSSTDA